MDTSVNGDGVQVLTIAMLLAPTKEARTLAPDYFDQTLLSQHKDLRCEQSKNNIFSEKYKKLFFPLFYQKSRNKYVYSYS